jgi:anti-anti-sigma factor
MTGAEIRLENFSTNTKRIANAYIVSMSGNADMSVHTQLKRYLDELHAAATGSGVAEIVFDLRDLQFMNSSCLSLLLRMLNVLLATQGTRYMVRFRSNSKLEWQKRSLGAIQSYAKEVVIVE